MRATPAMDDARLVRDIRTMARDVCAAQPDQNGPDVRDRIDALENRIRLASPTPSATASVEPRLGAQEDRASRPASTTTEAIQAARSPAGQTADPTTRLDAAVAPAARKRPQTTRPSRRRRSQRAAPASLRRRLPPWHATHSRRTPVGTASPPRSPTGRSATRTLPATARRGDHPRGGEVAARGVGCASSLRQRARRPAS